MNKIILKIFFPNYYVDIENIFANSLLFTTFPLIVYVTTRHHYMKFGSNHQHIPKVHNLALIL